MKNVFIPALALFLLLFTSSFEAPPIYTISNENGTFVLSISDGSVPDIRVQGIGRVYSRISSTGLIQFRIVSHTSDGSPIGIAHGYPYTSLSNSDGPFADNAAVLLWVSENFKAASGGSDALEGLDLLTPRVTKLETNAGYQDAVFPIKKGDNFTHNGVLYVALDNITVGTDIRPKKIGSIAKNVEILSTGYEHKVTVLDHLAINAYNIITDKRYPDPMQIGMYLNSIDAEDGLYGYTYGATNSHDHEFLYSYGDGAVNKVYEKQLNTPEYTYGNINKGDIILRSNGIHYYAMEDETAFVSSKMMPIGAVHLVGNDVMYKRKDVTELSPIFTSTGGNVYSVPADLIELTEALTANAGSVYDLSTDATELAGFELWKASDGDDSTGFQVDQATYPFNLNITFDGLRRIVRVDVKSMALDDSIGDFIIQYKIGSVWKDATPVMRGSQICWLRKLEYTAIYTEYRIHVLNGGANAGIFELKVYESLENQLKILTGLQNVKDLNLTDDGNIEALLDNDETRKLVVKDFRKDSDGEYREFSSPVTDPYIVMSDDLPEDELYSASLVGKTIANRLANGRVDFIALGDSNQLLTRNGWDTGFHKSLSKYYRMYATGLMSTNEQSANNIGRGYTYFYNAAHPVIGIDTGAPAFYNKYLNNNGGNALSYLTYIYLSDAETFQNVNTGLALESNSLLNPETEVLRYHLNYGTFNTGSGNFKLSARLWESPWTEYLESPLYATNTGVESMQIATLDLPFGTVTNDKPLNFRFSSAGTQITGPYFATYQRLEAINVSKGFSYHTMHYNNGGSMRDFAADILDLDDASLLHYLEETRRLQGDKKTTVMVVNTGVNDRAETLPSVGSGITDADSAEAYLDNFKALKTRIETVYIAQGWDLHDLFWMIIPSHAFSDPEDSKLDAYREIIRDYAYKECKNVLYIDMRDFTNHAEMANSLFYVSTTDFYHLSDLGYEDLSKRILDYAITDPANEIKEEVPIVFPTTEEEVVDINAAASNQLFITTTIDLTGKSVSVHRNGVLMKPSRIVSATGTTITFATGNETMLNEWFKVEAKN